MNTILWTEKANESYQAVIDYLLVNWGVNTTIKFEEKVNTLLSNLEQYIHFCPPSTKKDNIRRCTVNKQTSMVYQVVGDVIFIVEFFGNRSQNNYS